MSSTSGMYCLQCDYDLRALREHRCPECGGAFDPADARTFHTGEQYWPLAKVARAYAIGLTAIPYFTILFMYLFWFSARLTIGYWPQPYRPKAKRIEGVTHLLFYPTMYLLVYSLPAIALAALCALVAIVASLWTRQSVTNSLFLLLLTLITGAAFVAYARTDPHGILLWLLD